ncbi:hypothetical protein GJ496_000330 [Pomphorhynchus laevis]|nr:hypothetical protein GJ496_000330 [Pomphorhynchus laevis]
MRTSCCKIQSFGKVGYLSQIRSGIYKEDSEPINNTSQQAENSQRMAKAMKSKLKENMRKENWCFHYYGKIFGYNVALCALNTKQSTSRCSRFKVKEQRHRSYPKLKHNGVVVRLQLSFDTKGIEQSVYIGCQNHILDGNVRHVLDELFGDKTTSPLLKYQFVDEIRGKYEDM